MRAYFKERPWDLYLGIGFTVTVVAVLLALDVGSILAILIVLFIPGYLLVAVLFPGSRDIEWIERLALSIGLSIAVVPLIGLILALTPFGIRFAATLIAIASFTTLAGVFAWWRRMRLPPEDRLSAAVDVSLDAWKQSSRLDRILIAVLTASVVLTAGTVSYFSVPRPSDPFTEFYLLGPGGNASGYPTNLTVSETGGVIIGVMNHEGATVSYTVRIDLVGVRIVYNATRGLNEPIEVNRTTWSWLNTTLADGANWTQPYTFAISAVGLWKVQFLLYKNGVLSSPYRGLHLFVTVG